MLFVAHEDDRLAMIALNVFIKQGECVHVVHGSAPAPTGSLPFFSSEGKFASRFLRHVTERDAFMRGIRKPEWACFTTNTIAIRKATLLLLEATPTLEENPVHHAFTAALLHVRAQYQKPSSIPRIHVTRSRDEWTSGYHAKRRRRVGAWG